ncbi:TetR/AcrR family transcriptional regulator [Haloechinothrix halophila]|uniref:TetR/AcrR family transcriptional regulator n=1 Tax=Haloechinothrix halophila TaxID=1069073 RepID=UPI0038B26B9A
MLRPLRRRHRHPRQLRPERDLGEITVAATTLFSTKGFAATSVADIQVACGLTAGSGALYKHFPSKHALLSEIVRQHLESIADGRRDAGTLPDDPRETLELVAPLI